MGCLQFKQEPLRTRKDIIGINSCQANFFLQLSQYDLGTIIEDDSLRLNAL